MDFGMRKLLVYILGVQISICVCVLPSSSFSITSILVLICWCKNSTCSNRFSWHSVTGVSVPACASFLKSVCACTPDTMLTPLCCTSESDAAVLLPVTVAAVTCLSSSLIPWSKTQTSKFYHSELKGKKIRLFLNPLCIFFFNKRDLSFSSFCESTVNTICMSSQSHWLTFCPPSSFLASDFSHDASGFW